MHLSFRLLPDLNDDLTRVTPLIVATKSRNDFPNLASLRDADYFRYDNFA